MNIIKFFTNLFSKIFRKKVEVNNVNEKTSTNIFGFINNEEDFIVTKDETAGMLTVEEIAQKSNGNEMFYEFKKFFKYYSKEEVLELIDIIADNHYLSNVIEFIGEQNAVTPEIKNKLFYQVQHHYFYSDRDDFIKYCKPTPEEINVMANLSSNITDIDGLMEHLIQNNYKLTLRVEEVAYEKLIAMDKQIDEQTDMKQIYQSVSRYAYDFYGICNHLPKEKKDEIFKIIIKDIQYRGYESEYGSFKDGFDTADFILSQHPSKCPLSSKQRDEIFYKLSGKSYYVGRMHNDPEKYYLSKDKIEYLYGKMLETESGVYDLLKKEGLRFSQLKQIIRALPSFKNEQERNRCIDIISKNFRGTVAKDSEIKSIFDSLLVMKKLTETNKNKTI